MYRFIEFGKQGVLTTHLPDGGLCRLLCYIDTHPQERDKAMDVIMAFWLKLNPENLAVLFENPPTRTHANRN